MKLKETISLLVLTGLAAASDIVIPPDQPICKLYSLIQLFGTIGGIIAMSVAGFNLATSHDVNERNNAKTLISGSIIGLIIIWAAPLVVKYLVGGGDICGW